MKKVFFGGSFDPPHCGHLGVARAALASGRCSEVVWFPAYLPPHKSDRQRASFADRMNMVQLLIEDETGMSVSDFENRIRLTPSYTIDVLKALYETTGEKYMLLIGADSLLNLHLWHEAEKLVESVEILCYPRNDAEVTLEKLSRHWDEKTAEKLLNSMIEGTFFEISSTEIKNAMEISPLKHHIIHQELFPPPVAGYIRERCLYQ